MGLEFWLGPRKMRVTDIGTRVVVAICLDKSDTSWYNGPPYAIPEYVLDEYDLPACTLERCDD
jgi:hypothetical protein